MTPRHLSGLRQQHVIIDEAADLADWHFEKIARSRDLSNLEVGQRVLWYDAQRDWHLSATIVEIKPKAAYPVTVQLPDGAGCRVVLPGELTVVPPLATLEQVEAFLNGEA